ncbi:molybdenum hydroxylase [Tyzzerella sp. An114]|uniref:selenium-dependent molybdenum cofactor biosynthesis protein YqeB n=1 Tax=Tyzzerella sp. An114 TaxID=1965545 RepID=UPI000B4493E6|nr:selenium-dependent molybdenum cofactor biosynthesis protein YqeB [Tyzzerella sp. An114]OUQ58733.1 molybdenum hydroxylase [Tyzzerella sp. An114]
MIVVIRGAGDIATGIAWRLWQSHFDVIMTDLERPTAIRRTVAFSTAIDEGEMVVEGVKAVKCSNVNDIMAALKDRNVAVIADPDLNILNDIKCHVLVDAVLAKRNLGTKITDAPVVIGVGPGFTAGKDCHFVIETKRGHNLGVVIDKGEPAKNSGVPGNIGGYTKERIIRSNCKGVFKPLRKIGDIVKKDDVVAEVSGNPLKAEIDGMIRGMLFEGIEVTEGFKCGDIDPRGESAQFTTISDKARAVGGGVLEAVMRKYGGLLNER